MIKNYLFQLPKHTLKLVKDIGEAAQVKNVAVYLVGGVVRDIILKHKGVDLDFVVEEDAMSLAKDLKNKFKAEIQIYPQFGTVTLFLPNGRVLDFATARSETYVHSGALPTVKPGSLNDDLFRRDFTINALAIAINPSHFGELIDLFGGLQDIKKKAIRVLHDQSFMDDPTRILRAVRFEQRLGFHIESSTLQLLKTALKGRADQNVKSPRYLAEFKKIAQEASHAKMYQRLKLLKGFRFIDEKLHLNWAALNKTIKQFKGLRKNLLYKDRGQIWLIHFLGLISQAGLPMRKQLGEKFNLSREDRATIMHVFKAPSILKTLAKCRLASEAYDILKPLTMDAIIYMRIHGRQNCRRKIDRFLSRDIHVRLAINGDSLQKIGMTSGQQMGEVLKNVLHYKIDHQIQTKEEELAVVKKLLN